MEDATPLPRLLRDQQVRVAPDRDSISLINLPDLGVHDLGGHYQRSVARYFARYLDSASSNTMPLPHNMRESVSESAFG